MNQKIISFLVIIPSLGFASQQSFTNSQSTFPAPIVSECPAVGMTGDLAVLTDSQGKHHYRLNHATNSVEIYSHNPSVRAQFVDYLGENVRIDGCRDSKGMINVSAIELAGADSGEDQDQDQNGDQDQDQNGDQDQDQNGDQDQDQNGDQDQDQDQDQNGDQDQDSGQDQDQNGDQDQDQDQDSGQDQDQKQ